MDKLTNWLEKRIYPAAVFFQENKYLASIQYGMMLSIPLLLVGAFACIISDFPIDAFQTFMANLVGEEVWAEWNWSVLNPASIGLLSLVAMCGMSYELGRRNDVTPMPGVAISLMSFFLLIHADENGMISQSEFGATTLFLSIIVALVSVEIYSFCIKRKITIKMPASVPEFVSSQFAALIPAVLCAVLWLVVRYLIQLTPYETASNMIYGLLQAPLTGLGTSLVGTLIAEFINSVLWFFGIHGTNVVASVMEPLWYAARDTNWQVYLEDALAVRPYIATIDFSNMIMYLTGSGITLPLCIEMAFMCKLQRLKTVGKGAIIPGIFNVNEPVIFGLPIVMNPMMLIPFLVAPLVCVLVAFGAMSTGIVPTPIGVPVPWTLPAPISGWMMCGDWRGGALQIVNLIISGVIYWPFIKVLDREYTKEELGEQAPAEASA
ncbi:PTS sugar transporter subunit IIC [[Collinsella] massiliensis]|uniref:Permease IIC component n=1 Tax=[Collinsella] massiliensis TaxID=1232426 RepID=A0A1Y3XYH0_9ACTN|nr:PTS transporter subunit EIIC [[Collinsella] massiliensis]OUN89348.1 PTS lactose/cellobiose family IIC subunit [[Collinsella] massiliensis]